MEVIGLMEVVCCAFEISAEKESQWYVNKIFLSEHSFEEFVLIYCRHVLTAAPPPPKIQFITCSRMQSAYK